MNWTPDVPEIPIQKPSELLRLEEMSLKELDSMPSQEVDTMIRNAAIAIAKTFRKECAGDYESCMDVTTTALSQTGAGIGGRFGAQMVAKSNSMAEEACRLCYYNQ